jgi:hypothetical protein
VRFNGSSNIITGNVSITGTSLTAVIVAKINNGSGNYARIVSLAATATEDQSNTPYTAAILRHATNETIGAFRNNGLLSTKAITYATTATMASVYNGSTNTVYVNNSAGTGQSSSGSFNISKYRLGNNLSGSDSAWVDGDYYEVLIYDSALSGGNLSSVQTYLEDKWGL